MDATAPGLPAQSAAPSPPANSGLAEIDAFLEDEDSLKRLRMFCVWNLGHSANQQDGDDVLHDFYVKHRQEVVDTFKPGRQSLRKYFEYCLKRFCWKERKRLQRCTKNAVPVLEDCEYVDDVATDGIPLPETHEDWNPEMKLLVEERNQTHSAELSRLREAISKLRPADQLLVQSLYPEGVQEGFLHELSRRDVAQQLRITDNTLKVRHFRVIRRLRRILKVKP